MRRIVVIGAGVGGLTAAAVLARAGLDVTVLEAHVYPGGCAGTFYHQGYRFDAGATLAGGFYPGGPMDQVARAAGIPGWPVRASQPAMLVHLPDGRMVTRWGDDRRHAEYLAAFGRHGASFFRWQESTADALWNLALQSPDWPPQSPRQLVNLAAGGLSWLAGNLCSLSSSLLMDAIHPLSRHLKDAPDALRLFVDGQLLIAAQATSAQANALYGAAALDLPRRGVVHLEGGMGAIADRLVQAVRDSGGRVLMRQEVTRIVMKKGYPVAVETKRGGVIAAEAVIANLTPWNIAHLLGDAVPTKLKRLPSQPRSGWGAFTLYVGLDDAVLPDDFPLHHQVISREPLGEGNSIFLSFSPGWDAGRAPAGRRALTISTHTELAPWWELYQHEPAGYEMRKERYTRQILHAADRLVPGLQQASDLILPGTPVTFKHFTRRAWGWVGGFPQVNLLQGWGPRLSAGLWMVGDSIFPGQSVAAVALGGLRVARDVRLALCGDNVKQTEIHKGKQLSA